MGKNSAPTSEVIQLGSGNSPARLSFARLYTAKSFRPGQDARFEATFLLDPSNVEHAATIKKLQQTAAALAQQAFSGQIPPDIKLCITKGDLKAYDGYKGMIAIATHNKVRPTVVNRSRNPVAEGENQAPYSGCYVIGTITLWVQNNEFGKRINANLRGVQFVKDGQAFGMQPVDADDEFEALEDAPGGAPTLGADADPFKL